MAYTTDRIPTMTSNTAPSGVASASAAYSTYLAWNAMDDSIANVFGWVTVFMPGWLQYQFTSGKTIQRYTITSANQAPPFTYSPVAWTLRGSNNGTDWTTLDTQTGQSFTQNEKKIYDFSNSTSYVYYRLNITVSSGEGQYASVSEWELMEVEGFPDVVGNLSISLSPTSISELIHKIYEVIGDLSINLSPESLCELNYIEILGELNINLTPESTINRDYNVLGNLSTSFSPISIYSLEHRFFEIEGDLTVNLLPNSIFELTHQIFEVVGNLLVGLSPESTINKDYGRLGDLGLVVTPNAEYFLHQIFETIGNLLTNLIPESTINRSYSEIGTLGIVLSPESIINKTYERLGELELDLIPESTINRDYNRLGNLGISLTLESIISRLYERLGELGISLTPESIINRLYERLGNLLIQFIIESLGNEFNVWAILGNLSIGLIPNSLSELSHLTNTLKFIHNSYAYIITDTNPAQIIKVNLHNPAIYNKYTIAGKKNGKQLIINEIRDKLYASLNEGYVAKIDLNNPSTQTIFNVGESNQLNTITHDFTHLTTFVGDNVSGLSEFVIDESTTEVINTDLRVLLQKIEQINTYLCVIKGLIINTDLRVNKETITLINTDLRVNKYTYEDTKLYPLSREDFHVFIGGTQLGDDDLKLDSIQIVHTIDNKSTAKFTLLRKHDDLNNPTTITNNNVVTIYLGTELEFAGKISNLDCSSQDETVVVSCESDNITEDYNSIQKNLPLTVLNTQLHLYDVLLDDITIDNTPLDTRLIIVSEGGRYWTGSSWTRKLSLVLTFNTFLEAQSYLESTTYDTFIKANPSVDNYERSPKHYLGIKANLGKKIEESVAAWTNLSSSNKNAEEIEDGTFEFAPGFTYFWHINVILYDIPVPGFTLTTEHTLLSHIHTKLYAYIGTSLSSLSSDLYEITNCYYRYNKSRDDIETELGYYTLGTAPYKEISVKNGIKITKGRWVDKVDGLYWDKGISYNYNNYDMLVTAVELAKIQNINGDILPRTSASIDLTIDGYLYYNLKLLNRINLINTTVANTYKNANGFPISIKQINIDSNSMKVSISCDNEYSQGELDVLDVIYDNEPKEVAETSIKLYNKFDLAKWEIIEEAE